MQIQLSRLHPFLFRVLFFTFLFVCATVSHAQTSGGKLLPTEDLRRLADLFGLVQSDYVAEVDDSKLLGACMNGMLHSLDSQSVYLDKEEFTALRNSTSAVAGVGLQLAHKSGLPNVVTATVGSPAFNAGIRSRDYILAIDGESMEEMSIEHATRKLRGNVGSQVTLTVRRQGELTERVVSLAREIIQPQKVIFSVLKPGIGYIRISSFSESTGGEVRTNFTSLASQSDGKLAGLVLDLRDSPGGLLKTSGEVAAMFLPTDALVFSSEGRLKDANVSFYANKNFFPPPRFMPASNEPWPEQLKSVPLVLLINEGTSAGAEIVAGALKDHKRAILVGSKTYGKGAIQTIRQLDKDTAVKLTTAYWKTPGGHRIHNNGIAPDYPVREASGVKPGSIKDDLALNKGLELITEAATR